LLECC